MAINELYADLAKLVSGRNSTTPVQQNTGSGLTFPNAAPTPQIPSSATGTSPGTSTPANTPAQASPLSQVAALFQPKNMSVAPPTQTGGDGSSVGDLLSKPMSSEDGSSQDSTAAAADSNTSGLMPLLKKYWPVILSTLAAVQNREAQSKAKAAQGQLPSSFTNPLPQVTNNRAATPAPSDYYTYGQQPEHSYFSNNSIPTVVKARGGMTTSPLNQTLSSQSRYVPSQGSSGRADDVDAKLSNNEYVVDAETTALLGDGSPDAGAKKLDKMRANIRKHKGKKLSKGKISPNAKDAEDYL